MAFDQSTRNRLARFVSDARRILTDEFTRQCKQDFGIDPDTGEVSDVARLTHLNDTQRATARILRETLDHYVAGSPSGGKKASIDRIIREQAFTTLNRLCAVRMAEARGIVIESVGKGPQSKGFSLYARVAGSALGETADAYRGYLFSIFDELALDLPPLFDRFSPKGRLFPSATALESLLAEINHVDLDPLWGEDETIGWLYQYFNSIEERKQMRDESAAPRNSRELAVRNQFFTPRYVVEFLTDNTLGRIWYEMTKGETVLKDTCRYLVRRPSEIFLAEGQEVPAQEQATDNLSQEELLKQSVHIPHRPLKDPREIRLLDPACGSMHFGLYAFDLFTTIYDEAWELAHGPADARPQSPAFVDFVAFAATFPDKAAFLSAVPRLIIEHNIHGIDIDPRAVQIAGLSLWLRAQRAWHQAGVKPAERPRITRSHIVCAEPMPGEKALLQEFVQQQFQEGERPVFGFLLEQVFDQMTLAGEAGSLLRMEVSIRTSVAEAKRRWREGPKYEQSPLFPQAVAKPGQGQMRLDLSGITDEQFWERAEQRIYEALSLYSERAESGGGFQRRLFAEDAAKGFAFIDMCRKRFDVAVMNPPFGLAPRRVFDHLKGAYADTYVDLYGCFVARGIALTPGGLVGAITSRAFLMTKKLARWRHHQLVPSLELMIDLGLGVMDNAFVEAAAYIARPAGAAGSFLAVDRRHSSVKDQPVRLSDPERWFLVFRNELQALPGHKILYQLPHTVFTLLREKPTFEPGIGTARDGMRTFDDFRFVRLRWEAPPQSIGKRRSWEPLAKGGEHATFYSDLHLLVKWNGDGRELAEVNIQVNGQVAQSRQASDYYRRSGATYSKRSAKGFSARALPSGCIIGTKGPAVLSESDVDPAYIVGWLNSKVIVGLIHIQANAYEFNTGIIKQMPWRYPSSAAELTALTRRTIAAVRASRSQEETNSVFVANMTGTVSEQSARLESLNEEAREAESGCCASWDAAMAQLYGIQRVDVGEVIGDEDESPDDEVGDEDEQVSDWQDYASRRLVSHLLGAACGRWDVRYASGERPMPELPGPFEALPVCPPGLLQGDDGLPIVPETGRRLRTDGKYPLDIAWDGVLADDAEHPLDIGRRVRAALTVICGDRAEAIEQEVCALLDVPTLREWFRHPTRFFADHLKRYSKSRRQAPIYWPLSMPSGSYTLWLYYHRLTDQTLFKAANDFVEPKLQQIGNQVVALRGRSSRSSADNAELARLSDFEIELKEFRDELLRLAKMWKPNLNDGVVITAAPLWRLFQYKPWQKRLKETWEALEAGEYDWAHLAYSLWPERVREKCKHDKSLAIAHGLEELYQEAPAATGKKRGRKPKAIDPELMEDAE